MALQGTICDFGLGDIFQLIGIQRKTGVLTLENDREKVTVSFLDGQVVGAENHNLKLEDLLGAVLVRTGRIAQSQLEATLRKQKKTLQRLGFLLVQDGHITEDDLRDALNTQVTQIVYRLFRWRDGRYRFDPVEHLEMDENIAPISSETILMEGARMVDEWPIIERKIRSDRIAFRRTEAADRAIRVESIVDADLDLGTVLSTGRRERQASPASEGDDELHLSDEEAALLRMLDGRTTVKDLVDRLALGEFDTYRILYELLNRHLIEEVRTVAAASGAQAATDRRTLLLNAILLAAIFGGAAISAFTLSFNPFAPWRVVSEESGTEQLWNFASRGRIERIERAVELFFLDTGALPERLDLLVAGGYIAPRDTLDPWGRSYIYLLDSGSYTLTGLNARGELDPELTVSHRFSALQRMVLAGEGPGQI